MTIANAGSEFLMFRKSGGPDFTLGIDTADSNTFKLGSGIKPGVNDFLKVTTAGAVTIPGNLTVSGVLTATMGEASSSAIIGPDGTVAAPTFVSSNDLTSGIYFLGASHQVLVATNGIQAALFDTNQKLTVAGALETDAASNQLVINPGAHKFTVTAASPAADRVLTIPDPGGAANVLLSAGAQTVAGVQTFSAQPVLTAASNQLSIQASGSGNSIIITAANPASSSRTITIPDPGAAANFVLSQSAQTLAGAMTFSGNVSMNGAVSTASYDTASPANAATVTASANKPGLLMTPAGTIAGATVKLPSSPIDGQQYWVASSQIITTVTWQDAGGTAGNVIGGQASLGGTNRGQTFVYSAANTKWFNIA